MQKILYSLFSQYGRVSDVLCFKTKKMRGQAHILFIDQSSATCALRTLQGFLLNDKQFSISYSLKPSHIHNPNKFGQKKREFDDVMDQNQTKEKKIKFEA